MVSEWFRHQRTDGRKESVSHLLAIPRTVNHTVIIELDGQRSSHGRGGVRRDTNLIGPKLKRWFIQGKHLSLLRTHILKRNIYKSFICRTKVEERKERKTPLIQRW